MYDAGYPYEVLQRSQGELRVALRRRDERTVLDTLFQSGCLKARLPRPEVDGWAEVVTLNVSGGVVGGDRLEAAFSAQQAARVVIASQAAERFYRAVPGSVASVHTKIDVAAGAFVEWLPQASILFDGAALDRRLEVDMADDARFLGVESLLFGRAAMGETVREAWLRDGIRIRRGGSLVLNDAVRMESNIDVLLQRRAVAGAATALATVWYLGPDVADRLRRLREIDIACSAWDGMLVGRMLATDGAALRETLIAALAALRDTRPLPRVWLC
jgi:urease accessory protein